MTVSPRAGSMLAPSIALSGAVPATLLAILLAGCGTIGPQQPSQPVPATPPVGPSAPVPQTAPPSPSTPPPTPKQMVDQYIRYRCENGFDFAVTYQGSGTRALVERSGYSDLLRLVSAASGARYSDGKLTLHAKGDGAVLELPGGPAYRQCRSLPAKAAPKK